MKSKAREWWSLQLAKRPGTMVLAVILLFNILFFLISAIVISNLSLDGTESMGFFEAAFCTITMILDPGCIQFVIQDIGQTGVAVVLVCITVILIGMISFTGSVIGYITNYISNFINRANEGSNILHISDHIVILNWNTRASEIINDLLYCKTPQKVVVLVNSNRKEIEKEISERLSDTITRENAQLLESLKGLSYFERKIAYRRGKMKKDISVVVREGDIFSSKQLRDIAVERAKTIIILGNDIKNSICRIEQKERWEQQGKGNSQTIKTLMQVADITSSDYSADDQKIIVEVTDDWTHELVNKIIESKQVDGKCDIIPICINEILGQILSQFSLMPELNLVYHELFSNKGMAFFSGKSKFDSEEAFISDYLKNHQHAIPLAVMREDDVMYEYFAANSEKHVSKTSDIPDSDYKVSLNKSYWIERKNVVILGHNSKCREIMKGFSSFRSEWMRNEDDDEILKIIVIDDKKSLEKFDHYKEYPFVIETVEADIFDKDLICSTIEKFVDEHSEDTSVLILSDDTALPEDIDTNSLTNLIYVQDIVHRRKEANPDFDIESIDVIVELIDPKHHDIVNSYSVNNVVISNRYISKMITQIGEKDALYNFYNDILTYDSAESDAQSKEIYVKKVTRFFDEIPKKCTAAELIRAVYNASSEQGDDDLSVVMGYVKPGGRLCLFGGNQSKIEVELEERDKIIMFGNH